MKKLQLLKRACSLLSVTAAFAFLAPRAEAQLLIDPAGAGGFELGTTFAANGWSNDNGTVTNTWNLGTVPTGFTNRSAFVSPDAGVTQGYTNTATSIVHFWRDVTIPAGSSGVLTFNWQCLGETSSFDALMVSTAPTTYTPTASNVSLGTGALAAPANTLVQLWAQSAVQSANIAIPLQSCSAATTIRLIFTWKNDGSLGSNPSAAIDNISLTAVSGTPLAAGTYSVGPTGSFPTLTAAANAINIAGVSGNVFLELQPTYTSTPETFPIILAGQSNCSPLNASRTVTIRPQTGATALAITGLVGSSNVFDFVGGQWWRIDGRPGGAGNARELTVTGANTTASTIRLMNESSNNIIRFINLLGVNTTTTSGILNFSTTTGANGNDNNLVEFCDLRDGATTPHNIIINSGTTTTAATFNSNNTISNNNISNWFASVSTIASAGINLQAGATDWTISGNSLYQTVSRVIPTATVNAIVSTSTVNNGLNITGNFIGGTAPMCGGAALTYTGGANTRWIQLLVGVLSTSTVTNNTIRNINVTSSNVSGFTSMINLGSGRINCNNNIIGDLTTTGNITYTFSGSAARLHAIQGGTTTPEFSQINGNTIGSMTLVISGAPVTVPAFFVISIQGTVSPQTWQVNNNTIGGTVANSIQSGANANLAGVISFSSAIDQQFIGNTVQNLTNTNTGTGASSNGMIIQGSGTSPALLGTFQVNQNIIRNISTASTSATFFSAAGLSVLGNGQTSGSNLISQNQIHSISNTSTAAFATIACGAVFSLPTAIPSVVSKNFIHSISLANTAPSSANGVAGVQVNSGLATYQNNMIRVGIDAAGAAITGSYLFSGFTEVAGPAAYWHNTVYVGGTGVGGANPTFAMRSTSTTSTRNIRSNIFFNERSNGAGTGKHYAITLAGTAANPAGTVSDNNLLTATGTGGFLGLFNAVDQATLAAWRTATGNDFSSVTGNPQLINPTGNATAVDLHIQTGVATPIESAGAPITAVADDYDMQVRASLTPSDIGADAGNFTPAADLVAPGIFYVPLVAICGTANFSLNGVAITDLTGVPTTGGLVPRIYYRKGAGAWFSQAGTLAGGTATNSTWNFTVVVADMGGIAGGDVISYYIIAQDVVATPNIGSSLGGAVATSVTNVTTHPAVTNSVTVPATAFAGNYNIGAGGAYTTLTAAVTAYNGGCINAPTTFSLTDATYGAETFPITINQISGSSPTNTLTIKPAAGISPTISGSSTTWILGLNGADNIVIDGSNGTGVNTVCPLVQATRNLTIANTSTAATTAGIWVGSAAANNAQNNVIKNVNVSTGIGSTATTHAIGVGGATVGSSGANADDITIENNAVSRAYQGISILGTDLPTNFDNLKIRLNAVGTVAAALPSDNICNAGMVLQFASGAVVEANRIFNIIALTSATNSPTAITLNAGTTLSQILKNDITAIRQPNTGGWASYGINVSTTTSVDNILFANNTISDVTNAQWSTTSTTFNPFGIRLTGGINHRLYHNTINFEGTVPTGTTSAGMSANIGITSTAVTGADIRNNILVNKHQFGVIGSLAYNIFIATGQTFGTINNNVYSGASSANATYHIGSNGTTNFTTLAAWQGITGQDAASLTVAPVFLSATNLHLDPSAASNLCIDGSGAPLAAVTTDIDCMARNATTPDAGADEFTPTTPLSIAIAETSGTTNNDGTICAGASVMLTANGGGTAWAWNTTPAQTTQAITVSPAMTTTYTVTVTLAGCTKMLSQTVTVNTLPATPTIAIAETSGTTNNDGILCAGASAMLTSSAASSYLWSTTPAQTTQTISVSTAGMYTVTITNAGGCTNTASTTITVNPLPTVDAVANAAYCSGATTAAITFSSTPTGATFSWTNSNAAIGIGAGPTAGGVPSFTAANPSNTTTAVGNFAVQATLAGCTGVATNFTITVQPTIGLAGALTQPTTCVSTDGAINLTVTNSPSTFSYNWATPNGAGLVNGQEDQSGLQVGTYQVTVTNTTSLCTATASYSLPGPGGCNICPTVTAMTATPSPVCAGQTATLTTTGLADMGVTFGIQYKYFAAATATPYTGGTVIGTVANGALTGGGTTATLTTTALPAGTHFIYAILSPTATDPTCRPFATATIVVDQAATVNAGPAQTVCATTGSAVLAGSVGGSATSGTWSGGTGTFSSTTALNATYTFSAGDIAAGTLTLTLTSNDPAGPCPAVTSQVIITINPPATVNAGPDQWVCALAPTATLAGAFGGAANGLTWSGGAGTFSNAASPTSTYTPTAGEIAAGSVTLTATSSDPAGPCGPVTDQVVITINPTPTATQPTNRTFCNGLTTTVIAFTGTPGNVFFEWTNNNTAIGLAASGTGSVPAFSATNAGTAPISATITVTPKATTGGTTCTGSAVTFTITINPSPTMTDPADQTLCNGATTAAVTFTGNPVAGTTFSWVNNTPSIGLLASGTGGNIGAFTATNGTAVPVVATVTVTPIFTNNAVGCNGPTQSYTYTVNPSPTIFPITGSAQYCVTTTGIPPTGTPLGLAGSQTGVNYQLFQGATLVTTVAGTGGAISFGGPFFVGTYSVLATNTATGCTATINTGVTSVSTYDCSVSITDPCSCLNNGTTQTNGQFGEAVTINAPSSQTWTVIAVTGLFQTNSPAPPAAPLPIPIGTVVPLSGVNQFTLTGLHVDGIGYTVTVRNNLGTVLMIGETCYYPNFTFDALGGPYCISSPNVALRATVQGNPAGTASFKVNGVAQTTTAAGGGVYTASYDVTALGSFLVEFSFDAGAPGANNPNDPGCVTKEFGFLNVISTPAFPTCNDDVNISLGNDCTVNITPDLILEGTYGCFDDYSVSLKSANGQTVVNPITAAFLGQTLTATITHLPSGNKCWGEIFIEDKLLPIITCPAVDTFYACAAPTPGQLAWRYRFATNSTVQVAVPSATATDCSGIASLTSIVLSTTGDDCDEYKTVTRRWTAFDNTGRHATCDQIIRLKKPALADVVFPADRELECSPTVNTDPAATGSPRLDANKNGVWDAADIAISTGCTMQSAHTDQLLDICPGSYKIIRTWTVYDWCLPTAVGVNPRVYQQIIKVLDTTAPQILNCAADTSLSVDPWACNRDYDLPTLRVREGCSEPTAAWAVYTNPATWATQTISATIQPDPNWTGDFLVNYGSLLDLPIGDHLVEFYVKDACGNVRECSSAINIFDGIAPVAICQEVTQVAVGAGYVDNFTCPGETGPNGAAVDQQGSAVVPAKDFDSGSYDKCGSVFFKVKRMDNKRGCAPTGGSSGDFFDDVAFCCDDIGQTIQVIMRVYDLDPGVGQIPADALDGHWNDCMIQVLVEDKIKPVCLAPANQTVTCENYDPLFWYGDLEFYDNCGIKNIDTSIIYDGPGSGNVAAEKASFEQCNFGRVTKRWTVTDCAGNTSACQQTITVNYREQYRVEWPADKFLTVCDAGVDTVAPRIFAENCEVIGVSFEDQLFTVVPDACFKIIRKWCVINWCTYDANLPEVIITKQNLNALNGPNTWIGAGWSHAVPNPAGGFTVPTTGGGSPRIINVPSGTINAAQLNSPGTPAYCYFQTLKIQDQQDPQIVLAPFDPCDFTDNDPDGNAPAVRARHENLWNAAAFWDPNCQSHDLCEGVKRLSIDASDLCSGGQVNARYQLFLDLNGDGVMETVVNSESPSLRFGIGVEHVQADGSSNLLPSISGSVNDPILTVSNGQNPTTAQIEKAVKRRFFVTRDPEWDSQFPQSADRFLKDVDLPYGRHKIKWTVEDNCGNDFSTEQNFEVKDCKKPTIICQPLAGPIMNGPAQMVTIWATDFVEYAEDNCCLDAGWYSIRKEGAGFGSGQPPLGPNNSPIQSVTFSCTDPTTAQVEIWTRDKAGNYDFCVTYIQLNKQNCGSGPGQAGIAGALKTELSFGQNPVAEASVQLAGSAPGIPSPSIFTGNDGLYDFTGIPLGQDYTVTPTKDLNPTNGVSTFDLVLISKHILGAEAFSSPYKWIAGDVNKSGTVSTADIVELRKVILGIQPDFSNNESWRFVSKDYAFTSSNPAGENFPEFLTVAQLSGMATQKDFVSVKIGDINGNAAANGLMKADDRSPVGSLVFETADQKVEKGQIIEAILEAKGLEKASGFQFSLEFDGLELLDLKTEKGLSLDNFAAFRAEKVLTASWNGSQKAAAFALKFKAEKAGSLLDLLKISSKITRAEAYTTAGEPLAVELRGQQIRNPQSAIRIWNEPNPFDDRTVIRFEMAEKGEAFLEVFDATGKLLHSQKGQFEQGENRIELTKTQLTATGALRYRMTTAQGSQTETMLRVR